MRGFSVPLLLIAVVLVGGAFLFNFSSKNNDIMGVSTSSVEERAPGFSVSLISKTPAWDLVEYLCNSVAECLVSINSGKRVSTVSGGPTELREIIVEYSPSWDTYPYMKLLARPSWIIGSSSFRVVTPGDIPGTTVEKIPTGSSFQDVVLIPLDEVRETFYKSVTFSDR